MELVLPDLRNLRNIVTFPQIMRAQLVVRTCALCTICLARLHIFTLYIILKLLTLQDLLPQGVINV
jgi:hypothetical protein